jgi:hypothetical protein
MAYHMYGINHHIFRQSSSNRFVNKENSMEKDEASYGEKAGNQPLTSVFHLSMGSSQTHWNCFNKQGKPEVTMEHTKR